MHKTRIQTKRLVVLSFWLITNLFNPYPLSAQQLPESMPVIILDGEQEERFNDLALELRCPTCSGLSILDSEATFSLQIQNILKEQIQKGQSRSDIMDYFRDRYGPWILREPPKEGVHLFYWFLPFLLLMGMILALVIFLSRKQKSSSAAIGEFVQFDVEGATQEFLSKVRYKSETASGGPS